jgi:hypothetical protein
MTFMILLRDEDVFGAMTPEEQGEIVRRFGAWARKLKEEGRFVAGEPIRPEVKRFEAGEFGITVQDAPLLEAKDVVGGMFLFTAADWEEAVEVAKGCPSMTYGGRFDLYAEADYA